MGNPPQELTRAVAEATLEGRKAHRNRKETHVMAICDAEEAQMAAAANRRDKLAAEVADAANNLAANGGTDELRHLLDEYDDAVFDHDSHRNILEGLRQHQKETAKG